MLKEEFFQFGKLPASISILVSLLQFMSMFMLKEECFQWGRLCGRSVSVKQFISTFMLKEECFQSGVVMWPLQFQCLYYYFLFLYTCYIGVFSIGHGNVAALISILVSLL